jgi:hypothetical protein
LLDKLRQSDVRSIEFGEVDPFIGRSLRMPSLEQIELDTKWSKSAVSITSIWLGVQATSFSSSYRDRGTDSPTWVRRAKCTAFVNL